MPKSKKSKKPFDINNMTPEEQLKFEIAEELGLGPRILEHGWKCLTSKESGRIGGLITKWPIGVHRFVRASSLVQLLGKYFREVKGWPLRRRYGKTVAKRIYHGDVCVSCGESRSYFSAGKKGAE